MTIRFFNTLNSRRENFVPLDEATITMYVCGPTVYNYIHIGNARPLVIFDMVFRLLKCTYPQVKYIRNITDIDDKIINTAEETGQSINTISKKFIHCFHQDIEKLNLLSPSHEPCATDYIPQMIQMINDLLGNEYAYEAKGHVLFDVSKMANYGCLSKRKLDEMIAGARVDIAPYKNSPADFILWKPSTSKQPGWDSPWGVGRPGWHLECSVMAKAHLGKTIDIHGGGQDLIFPHHENEIAQSCCAHNTSFFARYWLHNGYILSDGKKMSKSLNNFFTLRDLLEEWHGEVIRYALLNTHYRKPLDWKKETLEQSKLSLDKLYRVLQNNQSVVDNAATPTETMMDALKNDLNTPQAIAELHKIAQSHDSQQLLASAQFLGLLKHDPNTWFQWQAKPTISNDEIEALIAERNQARKDKDYKKSDRIRNRLTEANIVLEDRDKKTHWRKQ